MSPASARQEADSVRAEIAGLVGRYPELEAFHRTVVGGLPDTCLPVLPRTALLVVTPDGLMQGLHHRLLDEHGDHVVAFRFRTVGPRLAELLYQDGLVTRAPERHIRSWWIKRKVFDLGEALILLLRHPTDHSFQATITDAKGASDPLLAQPGSYRATYRTPNKTFGLLHSSDDLLSMLYETSVLFGTEALAHLLVRPYWGQTERAVVSGYESGVRVPRIESYRVLYRLKRRLLAELAAAGLLPPALLVRADGIYRAALDVVDANPGHAAETEAVALLLAEEQGLLDGVSFSTAAPAGTGVGHVPAAGASAQCADAWTALACLRMLADPAACRTADVENLESSLQALGIPLSALERTVLESLVFFYFYPADRPRTSSTAPTGGDRKNGTMPTPYQQVLDAAETLEDYPLSRSDVAELGRAGLAAVADQLAFMIVTPDAVHRGKHADVLAEVHDAGFRIVAHRTRNLRDSDIEELYKYGLRTKILDHRRTHWHLTRKGLGMGTSLGLLLQHPDGEACGRLLRLKGASQPADAAPNSIRGSLRSYSKILALMHSSDTAPAVLRECLLYFTPGQVSDTLSHLVASTAPLGTPIGLVAEALSPTAPDDDPFVVLYAVKTRISHALADHPLTGPALQPLLEEHMGGLRTTRANLCANAVTWSSRTAAVRIALDREHKLLAEGLPTRGPGPWLATGEPGEALERLTWYRLAIAAQQLADHQSFGQLDMDQVRAALDAAHVHLTSWEMLLVENLLFFWET